MTFLKLVRNVSSQWCLMICQFDNITLKDTGPDALTARPGTVDFRMVVQNGKSQMA